MGTTKGKCVMSVMSVIGNCTCCVIESLTRAWPFAIEPSRARRQVDANLSVKYQFVSPQAHIAAPLATPG
jgi:hypothetical protein